MNPWSLALGVLALVLIIIGWTGNYPTVWHMITGHETTFGQRPQAAGDILPIRQMGATLSGAANAVQSAALQGADAGLNLAGLGP